MILGEGVADISCEELEVLRDVRGLKKRLSQLRGFLPRIREAPPPRREFGGDGHAGFIHGTGSPGVAIRRLYPIANGRLLAIAASKGWRRVGRLLRTFDDVISQGL